MRLLKIGDKTFDLDKQTIVMGVLNVTPDSFSDGGRYFSVDDAVDHAITMVKDGADIIDIGGESTRPGATTVSLKGEMNRVMPVIERLVNAINVPLSIDTYKAKIAQKALDAGVNMVNDTTALQGGKLMASTIAEYEVPVCLMHMKGNPRNMQIAPKYDDVVGEIKSFLKERAEYTMFCDIKKENIVIDPGLGFGKRTGKGIEDNCEILHRLSELKSLGFPIMTGASRKTFIGNVCGDSLPITERLEGSLAAACLAVVNGADIVRVHDVKETRRCVDLVDHIVR